ncbi:acetyl-CoA synthetase-like protein [Artomyces pyxidatus]|uniref:Acetyl-CoA synthetase-like protein n=1 Tax=Artomyces pyxidatus TaxID=48021 RepID=A0ACB8SGS9_9AGAM|nr:acetyl-CoA synthetase-like protein [Artomyces pyxidatus]
MPHLKSLYPPIPEPPVVNCYDFVFDRPDVKSWPDYTLHIDGVTGEKRRFRDFCERVADCATALSAPQALGGLGLHAGAPSPEFVGILSNNSLEFPVVVMSLLKIAVPIAFFPSLLTEGEVTALLRLSRLSWLFVSPQLYPLARAAAGQIGLADDRIIVLQGHVPGHQSVEDLVQNVRARNIARVATQPVQRDTLAYMVFSSGTSGLPKGVMISHCNVIVSTLQPIVTMQEMAKFYKPAPLNTPEKIPVHLAFLPFYHSMGLHSSILRTFLQPQTIVILPKWNPGHFIQVMLKQVHVYKISHLGVVPSLIQTVMSSPQLVKLALDNVVHVMTGAAYLPPELRDNSGPKKISTDKRSQGFGMSECTLAALMLPLPGSFGGTVERVPGMTGILLPGMEARIVRQDGSEADFDEAGELWLRGQNVALGYWNNEQATRETFLPDGWLRTGDGFKADRAVVRLQDTLKISGSQVSPAEIENTLLQQPDRLVTDVAVAGVQGVRLADEQVPRAWIVLSEEGRRRGEAAVFAALDQWARTRLSKPKWLRGGYEVVAEIPKLPTGKVLRRRLQEAFAAKRKREDVEAGTRAKL